MRSTLKLLRNQAPVSYGPRGLRMPIFNRNSPQTQMSAYGSVGTLFSIVHRISESTSQVNWRLWRKTSDGRRRYEAEELRTEVTRHAALDLWTKPNPWMVRQEFVEAYSQHLNLTGEGWWVIARSPLATIPLELWPVRPDHIAPVPDPDNFLVGYIYACGGEQVPLQVDEVIQLKMPNPLDPYRGLGPVQAVLTDLDSIKYSAEWNRNFFLNSAEPGGIIEFPDKLSDPEWEEFSMRWREQHQGVSAAHRVAILERGSWKPTGITQHDMQFVELRKVSREIIREAFGIHGHMLGLSEDINKANAEAGAASFGKWILRPPLERTKQALNGKLLPLFGSTAVGLEFDYDDPEPPDRESNDRELQAKTTAFKTLVDAGVDADDAAAICGLPQVRITRDGLASPATR